MRPLMLSACVALTAGIGLSSVSPVNAASPLPKFEKPAAGAQMRMRSNSIDYDKNGRMAIATGNVVITFGGYTLTADRVAYDKRTRILRANGHVRLREPGGAVFETDNIELSDSFRDAFAKSLQVLLTNEAVITAKSARRVKGNVTTYTEATYTRCSACASDPAHVPTWLIRADKITHNKIDRTLAYEGAAFEFLGGTLVQLPNFSHADPTVSRQSGLLTPSFATSDAFGFGVEIPYFWNIAPDKDITFRPLFTTKQGPLLRATWRQAFSNGAYSITPIGIYQFTNDQETPSDTRFRGAVLTQGQFKINDHWKWGWNATLVSDDTFLRRYGIDKRTDLTSQIYVEGLQGRNYFTSRLYHFRGLLLTDDNDLSPYVLPAIDHTYYFANPFLGGETKINTSFISLHRDTGPTSTRLVSQMHWQRQMVSNMGAVFTPFASVRGGVFFEDNVIDPLVPGGIRAKESFARVMPIGGLDVRMPFVQTAQSGTQQIFEPIMQILFRPNETKIRKISNEDSLSLEFEETNLFDYNKFSGVDRWEGGTRANVGFNHTVLFNNGNYLKFTLGESFHLLGKNSFAVGSGLKTDRSDFVAALQVRHSDNLQFSGRVRIDESTGNLRRTDLNITTHWGALSTLLHYTDADSQPALGETKHREEIFFQTSLKLSQNWDLFGKIRYDIKRSRRISNAVGFRYDDESFTFYIQYKEDFTTDRDIDINRAIIFKVDLKTISSSATDNENSNTLN